MSHSISIATPTHNTRFLLDLYKSIKNQDYLEWVLYPNSGATVVDIPWEILDDPRTVLLNDGFFPVSTNGLPNIGSIKKYLFGCCKGDIILEQDHDDILVDGAIDKIRATFEDPKIVFTYANTAAFNEEDKSPRFFGNATAETNEDTVYGWKYRDFWYKDTLYKEAINPELNPFHASLILFQPDHPRAFRRSTYEKIGGHDENLNVLDDSDLMCRFWLEGDFHRIDECLYLYRVYGDNSWLQRNADIQNKMHDIQKQYIYQMIVLEAQRKGLPLLDLGGRFNSPPEFTSVDLRGAAINCDLNKRFPFEDSSVGVIRAFDIIEHLSDKNHTMSEIHRVLCPGGYALINVPSTEGNGAHMDPSHITFWNEGSFLYYTDGNSAQYIDNTTIRFKPVTLYTHSPNEWCQQNRISYVSTILMCLKEGYRPHGEVKI
jgi:hypothetical protein